MALPIQVPCLYAQSLFVKHNSRKNKHVKNLCLYLIIAFLLIISAPIYAQLSSKPAPNLPISSTSLSEENNNRSMPLTPSCPNSDFSTGDFTNWEGYYGTFSNPSANIGFVTSTSNPRHMIIKAPGTHDDNTCNGLTTVPPGAAYAARLGNDDVGAEAEQLRYTLTVSDESNLFIYKYAVVFEDPGHDPQDQPSFTIEVTNEAGQVFDSVCGYYYVYSHQGIPGWNRCDYWSTPVLWKDWTTVGLDLSPYLGQTINIVFTTRDCKQSQHFGYAYLSTSCSKMQMSVDFCSNHGSITMSAPPGFSYLWSNGAQTQSITIVDPPMGQVDSCILTSVNGCKVTIKSVIYPTLITADFSFMINGPQTEIPFFDLSTINHDAIANWEWEFGDGSPVVSHEPNPKHTYANRGTYNVTLTVHAPDGCADSMTKSIKVDIPSRIFFANAFSPNNDGLNDVFIPEAVNVGHYHLSIFNRYGQSIFESYNLEEGWDGTINGEPCPAEVYIFMATYELMNTSESKTTSGTLTLVR